MCAGKSGHWSVIFFQQLASIGNNITIQIVAGQAMKVRKSVLNVPLFSHQLCRHVP